MKQRHKRKQSDQSKHYRSLEKSLAVVFKRTFKLSYYLKEDGSICSICSISKLPTPSWNSKDREIAREIVQKMKKYEKYQKERK